MRTALFGVVALACVLARPGLALADPELKGTRAELSHYLLDERRIVSIYGEGKHTAQADTAIVSLAVKTKHSKLNQALEDNKTLRLDIEKSLKDKGIPEEKIKASKFSSTPNHGWFGKEPSSYEVNNEIKVTINDEKQLVDIAKIVDMSKEVSLVSTEFEQSAEQQHKLTALEKSLSEIEAKKQLYEKALKISLTTIKIIDQDVIAQPAPMLRVQQSFAKTMEADMQSESSFAPEQEPGDFGEMTYTARTRVEFIIGEQ